MAGIDYDALNSQVAKRSQPSAGSNPFYDFVKSSMESVPEMIGIPASLESEQYRAENPGLGLVSELLPTAAIGGGWWKATEEVPALARLVAGVAGRGMHPVLSGAAQEMARFAPLELGRIAGSAVAGDNTGDVAKSAALDMALAGAGGGVGGLFRAGGPRVPPIPEISSEVNLRDAVPLQLRSLKEARAADTVTSPDAADFWINRLKSQVMSEGPTEGPHVAALEGAEKLPKDLNRLFKGGPATSIVRRKLVPQDWPDQEDLAKTLQDSGLGGNEDSIQFPRYVSPVNQKGANEVFNAVRNNLQSAGDGVWFSKEADDGLYVIAKRFERGDELDPGVLEATDAVLPGVKPRKPELDVGTREGKDKIKRGRLNPTMKGDTSPGDKWVLFKTDQPERWVPPGTEWNDKLVRTGAWDTVDYSAPTGTPLNNVLQKSKDLVGFRNFKDAKADPGSWLQAVKKRLGVGPLQGEAGMAAKQAYDFVKEYAAPSTWQFLDSPRASYLFNVARSVFDAGKSTASALMYGEQRMGKEYSFLKNIVAGVGAKAEGRPSINAAIESLYQTPKDVFDVWRAQLGGWDQDAIRAAVIKGDVSPKAAEFLDLLNTTDAEQFGQVQATQKSFGLPVTKALPGHRMISNTFKGSIRTPVFNERGNLVALASGNNRRQALDEADALVVGAKEQGKTWTRGYKDQDYFTSDYSTDVQSLLEGGGQHQIRAGISDQSLARMLRERYFRNRPAPGTAKIRSGMGGFVGENLPWEKKELTDIIESHLKRYQSYMAELNVKNGLQGQMKALAAENPRMSTQLQERINDMAGRPGAFSQLQNQFADKLLAPYVGKDSASKIVATVNKYTHHFQLGMGNISFPILNALTFMQTVVPHVAFVTKATREDLAKYYGWALTAGSDGLPRRGIGFLQMPRLMAQSFQELGKPTAEMVDFMSRGIRDGVLDPKIVEEFAGQNSSTIGRMQEALSSLGGFGKWVESVSNFLPAASERFSRSHAFSTGYVLGRDFFGLKDEQLYNFSKLFTERTMFGYGVVDRAKVLSGPLGNLTGLYKNWQMHYMGWLLEYMNQATQGNMAPLAWSMAGTAAVGGVAASPFYFVADQASRMLANKSAMQMIYDNFGGADSPNGTGLSDAIYYGLPSFAGISLQGSAAAPGANPVRDAAMLFSLVQWKRMQAMGKALGGAIDEYGDTGQNPVKSREVRDAMIQWLAPSSMQKIAQSVQDGTITSLNTGNPLAEASPAERVLYGLGLNPIQVTKQMDVSNELYTKQNALRDKVKVLGMNWSEAQQRGDWRELQVLMLRAMADGVPLDSVMRSAASLEGKAEADSLERRFKQDEIEKYTSILGRR